MAILGISVNGAQEAAKKLAQASVDMVEATRRAVVRTGLLTSNEAYRLVSGPLLKVRTGTLRSAINADPSGLVREVDGWSQKVGVRHGNADPYAPLHEYGGNVNRLGQLRGGRFGPGRPFVAHYKARRYMGTALDLNAPKLPLILQQETQKAIDRANRG